MIKKYASGLAEQFGLKLSKVSLVDGLKLGCRDIYLLNMSSKEHIVSAIIFRDDLERMKSVTGCDRLELRIRYSLARLQTMIES